MLADSARGPPLVFPNGSEWPPRWPLLFRLFSLTICRPWSASSNSPRPHAQPVNWAGPIILGVNALVCHLSFHLYSARRTKTRGQTGVWGLLRGAPRKPPAACGHSQPTGLPASALSLQLLLPVARGLLLGIDQIRPCLFAPNPLGLSFSG